MLRLRKFPIGQKNELFRERDVRKGKGPDRWLIWPEFFYTSREKSGNNE